MKSSETMEMFVCDGCSHMNSFTSLRSYPARGCRRIIGCSLWYEIFQLMLIFFSIQSLPTLSMAKTYSLPLKVSRTKQALREDVMYSDERMEKLRKSRNMFGKPGQGYYLEMSLGQPPQMLNVLADTGSSNFAVAAAPHPDITKYFDSSKSETFVNQGTEVYVPYTQGNWKGHLGQDEVSMAALPNVTVTANIACITSSHKFFINGSHWQGILGLAFESIARPDSSVEPFFDSLVHQADVNNTFSMQLCGTVGTPNETDASLGGTLVLGGIDESLYNGPMVYAPLYKEWYYEVIVTDIKVDSKSLKLDCKEYNFDKTIVDSGTTNLRLPQKVFHTLVNQVAASVTLQQKPPKKFWDGSDYLCWDAGKTPWNDFPPITITLAESHNSTFDLILSSQLYLRAVRDEAQANQDCYKFAVAPSDTGTVLGAVVMEGFYVVFDRDGKRVGFAKSTCPKREPSIVSSKLRGPTATTMDTFDCAYIKPTSSRWGLTTVAYVMAGICGACVIPLILMMIQWQWNRCRRPRQEVADVASLLKEEEDK